MNKIARCAIGLALAFSVAGGAVFGQQYPVKPIRMVVPIPRVAAAI